MIRHPEIAAWYEKEDITFITLARSHVTFENSAKEVKKLKPQKSRMMGFSFTSYSLQVFVSVVLGFLNSFLNLTREPKKKFHHPISEDGFGHGQYDESSLKHLPLPWRLRQAQQGLLRAREVIKECHAHG
jgi:hypothetical protein